MVHIKTVSNIALCAFALMFMAACSTPMAVGMDKHEAHFNRSSVPSNKGAVYFYRDSKFVGSARGIYITANGERIGALNSGTYFVYEATPGKTDFAVENWLTENDATRTIDVKAGEDYYLQGDLAIGFWDAIPKITIVHKDEGRAAIGGLKYATIKAPATKVEDPKEY